VADPVGNAERAEFGEVSIVEDENEMTGLFAEALQHVTVSAGEVPDVARVEIVRLGIALRINHGGPNATFHHESPLRRCCVPVKFPHRPGFEPHRDSRNAFGNRQLGDRRLLPEALVDDLTWRPFESKFERRQFIAG
jgi:hypothetical protein